MVQSFFPWQIFVVVNEPQFVREDIQTMNRLLIIILTLDFVPNVVATTLCSLKVQFDVYPFLHMWLNPAGEFSIYKIDDLIIPARLLQILEL